MHRIKRKVFRFADTENMPADKNALFLQPELCDRARKHHRRGQPSGKMSAAAIIVKAAVPDPPGIVGMRRTGQVFGAGIVARTGVAVADDCAQGRAGRKAFKNAAYDLGKVAFQTRSRKPALFRPPPVQFAVDKLYIDRDPGGKVFNDNADRGAMGFAEDRISKLHGFSSF